MIKIYKVSRSFYHSVKEVICEEIFCVIIVDMKIGISKEDNEVLTLINGLIFK